MERSFQQEVLALAWRRSHERGHSEVWSVVASPLFLDLYFTTGFPHPLIHSLCLSGKMLIC